MLDLLENRLNNEYWGGGGYKTAIVENIPEADREEDGRLFIIISNLSVTNTSLYAVW